MAKPWVGYMTPRGSKGKMSSARIFRDDDSYGHPVPVAVVPYEPGEPKLGETWVHRYAGKDVKILSAPFPGVLDPALRRVQTSCGIRNIKDLRPKPELKTFRAGGLRLEAESREAALEILAATLEEV